MEMNLTWNKIKDQIGVWQPKTSTAIGNIGATFSPISPNEVLAKWGRVYYAMRHQIRVEYITTIFNKPTLQPKQK